jgi:hypothetical protein
VSSDLRNQVARLRSRADDLAQQLSTAISLKNEAMNQSNEEKKVPE